MKNTLLSSIFLLSAMLSFATDTPLDQIVQLQALVSKIDASTQLTMIENDPQVACGTSQLRGYFDTDGLQKAVDVFEYGNGMEVTELYYAGGELSAIRAFGEYENTTGAVSTTETMYYHINGSWVSADGKSLPNGIITEVLVFDIQLLVQRFENL